MTDHRRASPTGSTGALTHPAFAHPLALGVGMATAMGQHDRPQPTSPRLTPTPAGTRPEQPDQWKNWADQRISHAQRPGKDQREMILKIKITPAADPRIQA